MGTRGRGPGAGAGAGALARFALERAGALARFACSRIGFVWFGGMWLWGIGLGVEIGFVW
jgi:hypothetical protein